MSSWRLLADLACESVGTPCYVLSARRVQEGIARLKLLESSVPLRHWVSVKTQPVAQLVRMAVREGLGVDVVSEFELTAALQSGVPPSRILVNGVAKHHWLARFLQPQLNVHFDSIAEIKALTARAKALHWNVGLRCAIRPQDRAAAKDAHSEYDQFGMTPDEIRYGARLLKSAGVEVRGLHFHLHTNASHVSEYQHALVCTAQMAEAAGIEPEYLDVGGGLPIAGETSLSGISSTETFDLTEYREWLAAIPSWLPSVREVWLENGRFLSGPAGVLVITVLDTKQRDGRSFLICDGGRVNHARMAAIERHGIAINPRRTGALRESVICGPTCGAVDRLGVWMLPDDVAPGDRVIWLTAGAYHIPLETRFSTGLAPVVWFNKHNELEIVRQRESALKWWGQWVEPAESSCVIGADESESGAIARHVGGAQGPDWGSHGRLT